MIDVVISGRLVRKCDVIGITEAGRISIGPFPPESAPLVDMLQLGAQHSGVNVIQAAVGSHAMAGPFLRPVIAQPAYRAVYLFVIRDDGPAIAETSQVLLDDKARADGIAQLADPEAVAAGPNPLRIILDDQEIVPVRDLADCLHVGTLPVKMDRHQRLG